MHKVIFEMETTFSRYSRQIFIEEVGVQGQRAIMGARVLVIGAGGLGSPVIQYLAAAGVGHLAVVDFDKLEVHNLNRQVIHNEQQVGQYKVDNADGFVRGLNSSIDFRPIREQLNASNAKQIIQAYDIIVEGSDNFETRYLVNDTCVQLNKVLVYGSIFAFQGQLAVFNHQGSKHLRELFPTPPAEHERQTCDQFGVLGPLPGVIGSMMAMQVLKIIVGLPVRTNQLTVVDFKDWHFQQIDF